VRDGDDLVDLCDFKQRVERGKRRISREIMNIRIATDQDRADIRRIYSSAFPKGESEIVAKLAIDLLFENTTPQTISLVAEADDSIVGHVAFSPVGIDNNENFQAYILAPLAVQPDYQKNRIGSKLIEYGMQELSALGVNVVLVYGDPKYYGRFGFSADAAHQYTTPYKLQYPFGWQAIVLNECAIEKSPVAITCVTSLCDPNLW
jgi:putative acetyltransferase